MKDDNELDEQVQRCLNPNCGVVLFVSGKMATDAENRGVDRDIHKKHDEKGYYIECPKCGIPGEGLQWSIDGLRD